MRVRATHCVALGLAGLLSIQIGQALAADDISRRNNLNVTRPTAPRHPDDSFSRMFPGLPPYAPATDEARAIDSSKSFAVPPLGCAVDPWPNRATSRVPS